MRRLARFEAYRYIGARDTMRLYDCDDDAQYDEISARVRDDDMVGRNLIQVFAPDTPTEAMNRGFRPAAVAHEGSI